MGKSTLLAMEARVTARNEREALESGRKTLEDVCLPVYLRFAELRGTRGSSSRTCPSSSDGTIRGTAAGSGGCSAPRSKPGRSSLLFDALDEVARDERQALAGRLDRLVRHYPCPIVCTSRLVGYGAGTFAGMKEVEIRPLGDDQQRALIRLSFTDVDESEGRKKRVDRLLRQLRSKPQVRSLTRNPLLLSMVCSLYHDKATLPDGRSQVYAQALRLMLGEWSAQTRWGA